MAAFTTEDTGKGVWWVIHIMARVRSPAFPETVKTIANNFFCDKCGEHFRSHLAKHPIPHDPSRWFEWTVNVHNIVNRNLNKRVIGVSEAIELFTHKYADDGTCLSCPRNDFSSHRPPVGNQYNYAFRQPMNFNSYQPFSRR